MSDVMSGAMGQAAPVEYNPYSYEAHEDPYPIYARLRTEAPVYRNEELDFWALSRHADVMEGFRDATRLSSSYGVTLDKAAWGPWAHKTMSFLAMDEPRHGRMRGLVSRAFTPRRVTELEPRVREMAARLTGEVVERGGGDLIADFAGILPMDVISELLGVPVADRPRLRQLADLMIHREEGVHDVPPAGIEAAFELAAYYQAMVDERRANPGTDLVSALLMAEIDGDRLSDDEIVGFLYLMVVAGNETTTKLLGHAWFWADVYPDQKAFVWADPSQIGAWVEETLRFDTSSQMLARIAVTPIELHGVTIPDRGRVLLLAGSANRDPAVFADPDSYDVARADTSGQLASFGYGRHYCMGASLARLEARVVLEEWVAAVGSYEIDRARARRVHSVNVRGFAELPAAVVGR